MTVGLRYISSFALLGLLVAACAGGNGSGDPDLKNDDPGGPGDDPHGEVTEPVLIPQKIVLSQVDVRDGQLVALGLDGAFSQPEGLAKRSQSAVTASGWVTVASDLETVQAPIGPNGSFVATLQANPGSEISIQPHLADETAGEAVVEVAAATADSAPTYRVEVQTSGGWLTVSSVDNLPPNQYVLLANDQTREVYEVWVDGFGAFQFDLLGEMSDMLILLLTGEAGASAPLRGLVDGFCPANFCAADELCVDPPGQLKKDCEPLTAAELAECSNGNGKSANPRLTKSDGLNKEHDDDDDDDDDEDDKKGNCKPDKCKLDKLCGSVD